MILSGVAGQWKMGITIGGKPYPNPNPVNVPQILVFESIHQALPSLNLTLKDYTGEFIGSAASGDGTKIDVVLGDGRSGDMNATFNVQGSPQVEHGGGYSILKINAVLDTIEYMRTVASGLYEGSSGDAIAKIAGQAGLSLIRTTSADSQVWLPTGKTLYGFAKEIANHGYAGSNSLMAMGVSVNKELIYGDINQLINTGAAIFGVAEDKGHFLINDWTGSSNGMIANNSKGYGSTSYSYDAEGVLQELSKVTSTLFGSFFGFSAGNQTRVGPLGGRLDLRARPAGNTHEKYLEAEHQNERMRSLWSTDLNVLLHQYTGTRLLSGVTALPPNYGAPKINEVFAGRYVLTAKTTTIVGAKYTERCTLTSNGTG